MILQSVLVSDIGLYELVEVGVLPGFSIGIVCAFLHWSGKMWFSQRKFRNLTSFYFSVMGRRLYNSYGIVSSPGVVFLLGLRTDSSSGIING